MKKLSYTYSHLTDQLRVKDPVIFRTNDKELTFLDRLIINHINYLDNAPQPSASEPNNYLRVTGADLKELKSDIEDLIQRINSMNTSTKSLSWLLIRHNLLATRDGIDLKLYPDRRIHDRDENMPNRDKEIFAVKSNLAYFFNLLESLDEISKQNDEYHSWLCHLTSSNHMNKITALAYALDIYQQSNQAAFCIDKKTANTKELISAIEENEVLKTLFADLTTQLNQYDNQQEAYSILYTHCYLEKREETITHFLSEYKTQLLPCNSEHKSFLEKKEGQKVIIMMATSILCFAPEPFNLAAMMSLLYLNQELKAQQHFISHMDRSEDMSHHGLTRFKHYQLMSKIPPGHEAMAIKIATFNNNQDDNINVIEFLNKVQLWEAISPMQYMDDQYLRSFTDVILKSNLGAILSHGHEHIDEFFNHHFKLFLISEKVTDDDEWGHDRDEPIRVAIDKTLLLLAQIIKATNLIIEKNDDETLDFKGLIDMNLDKFELLSYESETVIAAGPGARP
jgi:hypothetical protein